MESQFTGLARKRFGLVVAVYDVARYLPEFIESIDAQTRPLDDFTIVVVDDGSTDGSLALLEAWSKRRPELVTVISQENGGPASARNSGLDVIDCEWVSFPDADDALDPNYFKRVAKAIDTHADLGMVATNRLMWHESTGELRDEHPLRSMFRPRDQVKNLDGFPEHFHGSASASFLRLDVLNEHGLRFDTRIQPTFEGGHLLQRYLLRLSVPQVAFLKSAVYRFRKRADQSSLTDKAPTAPGLFLAVPRHGYLELLEEAVSIRGRVPDWLQNVIIDELATAIRVEENAWVASVCVGAVAEEFVEVLSKIRALLDDDVIKGFTSRGLKARWRQILLYGLRAGPWHTPYAVIHRYDDAQNQVLVGYRFVGPEPDFEAHLRGEVVQPVASKIRDYRYWDQLLMRERLAWLPANGTLRVRIDHRYVEIRTMSNDLVRTSFRPTRVRRMVREALLHEHVPQQSWSDWRREAGTRYTQRFARSWLVRRRFGQAWVVMDRVGNAGDNGWRLFEYLRNDRPDVNAWFVLHRDSSDWAMLRKQNRRLIAYGSWRWRLLMLNCRNLISSHVDHMITRPVEFVQAGRQPPWKFVFLQHGVIKNDISGWLNNVLIDLFVTSSPGEHESIVADGSQYVFTEKEVKMTGLARFDRLREIGQRVTEADQRIILVAPTWRNWLKAPRVPGEHTRRVIPDFMETEYAHNWLGMVTSPDLAELCRSEGLRIGFLPHPDLQPVLKSLELPDHVDALSYSDSDVQELFAKAAVMVTDYSSVAFNSAYIDRPVVYFQFDKELIDAGAHLGTPGYFEYERDGFGPVAYTLEQAVEAVSKTVLAGRRAQAPFDERIRATFPDRDGNCCERTVAEIERLDPRPARPRRSLPKRAWGRVRRVLGRIRRKLRSRLS